mmetsp:Transcript_43309/g.98303  ORF Transcript_43309/g.98303 Transcript_43309/m.98303 type:complete len:316 (-) Transcript_43309:244-1191(-)
MALRPLGDLAQARVRSGEVLVQGLQRVLEAHVGLRPQVPPCIECDLGLVAGLQVHLLVVLLHALIMEDLGADPFVADVPVLSVDAVLLVLHVRRIELAPGDDPAAELHVLDVGSAALEHFQGSGNRIGVRDEDHVVLHLLRLLNVRLNADDEPPLCILKGLGPDWLPAEDLNALAVLGLGVEQVHAQRPGDGSHFLLRPVGPLLRHVRVADLADLLVEHDWDVQALGHLRGGLKASPVRRARDRHEARLEGSQLLRNLRRQLDAILRDGTVLRPRQTLGSVPVVRVDPVQPLAVSEDHDGLLPRRDPSSAAAPAP